MTKTINTLPLPEKGSITPSSVDSLLAINAASGYTIWLIDEFERRHKVQWAFATKKFGNLFREELLKVVNVAWRKENKGFDEAEVSQQQADSYVVAEHTFNIALQATLKLDEGELQRFREDLTQLAKSYGLEVDTEIS